MPSALNIPESDRAGILLIRDLPEDAFATLLISLQRSSSETPALPSVSRQDAEEIVSALRSMYRYKAYAEVSTEEFVSDLVEALHDLGEISPANEPIVRKRFRDLLDIEEMQTRAKAALLFLENERTFCEARILTDARPVFGTDVSAPPLSMAIQHLLRISFHEGAGNTNEIYLALRPRDLQELRGVINRAEQKEKSLRAALEGSSRMKTQ